MITMLFSYAVPPPGGERMSVVAVSNQKALAALRRCYPYDLDPVRLQIKINDTWQPAMLDFDA